jgi:hypothetical protein
MTLNTFTNSKRSVIFQIDCLSWTVRRSYIISAEEG